MFDHISIGVADLDRSQAFYDAALAALGYERLSKSERVLGYGPERVAFWVAQASRPVVPEMDSGLHFCFVAPSEDAVREFHAKGLAAGGSDNGSPGVRPEYGQTYYAAFVIDPDGYRLEAYFRMPD
jgi:catechol 2,3-dioxygenase-like lactoylglutathione lyase family enzyme